MILTRAEILKLGPYKVRKGGKEFVYKCPKCHRNKLEVNFFKRLFNCFRCGYSGVLDTKKSQIQKLRVIEVDNPITIPGFYPFRYYYHTLNPSYTIPLLKFIESRGLYTETVMTGRWGFSTDIKLQDRLIIPIYENQQIMCYVARAISGSQEPKELCPSGGISNRSHFLYNLDNIYPGQTVVAVEGIFDVEHLTRGGYNAVAVMGSHMSDIQIGKLISKRPSSITLFFDGDEAGRVGAIDTLRKLSKRYAGSIKVATPPLGKDPDDLNYQDLRGILV